MRREAVGGGLTELAANRGALTSNTSLSPVAVAQPASCILVISGRVVVGVRLATGLDWNRRRAAGERISYDFYAARSWSATTTLVCTRALLDPSRTQLQRKLWGAFTAAYSSPVNTTLASSIAISILSENSTEYRYRNYTSQHCNLYMVLACVSSDFFGATC